MPLFRKVVERPWTSRGDSSCDNGCSHVGIRAHYHYCETTRVERQQGLGRGNEGRAKDELSHGKGRVLVVLRECVKVAPGVRERNPSQRGGTEQAARSHSDSCKMTEE